MRSSSSFALGLFLLGMMMFGCNKTKPQPTGPTDVTLNVPGMH
jgi:hypothetical protein